MFRTLSSFALVARTILVACLVLAFLPGGATPSQQDTVTVTSINGPVALPTSLTLVLTDRGGCATLAGKYPLFHTASGWQWRGSTAGTTVTITLSQPRAGITGATFLLSITGLGRGGANPVWEQRTTAGQPWTANPLRIPFGDKRTANPNPCCSGVLAATVGP